MSIGLILFLIVALVIALAFEAINGFHDTANAVATVIYTKSLQPQIAVVWSGLWNFIGVLVGGIAVAFSIVHLLPVELLADSDQGKGIAMVLALLIGAMIWNFGTWFMGIPASSSHALIGSIIGVGLANSAMAGKSFGSGVNWGKAGEVGLSLFMSPLIGFGLAFLLLIVVKTCIKNPKMHEAPEGDKPPPWWVRGILILTCTGVSFAHGSNDGQKGMGLIMLILIGLVPAYYAIEPEHKPENIAQATLKIEEVLKDPTVQTAMNETRPIEEYKVAAGSDKITGAGSSDSDRPELYQYPDTDRVQLVSMVSDLQYEVEGKKSFSDLSEQQRWAVRSKILFIDHNLKVLIARLSGRLPQDKKKILDSSSAELRSATEYVPGYVKFSVALALGLGTMVGWKRIVVTIGEKIGKTHLTYAQGASAEVVAMGTIMMADHFGLPVSTTHVLSSGVAGTMAANRSGLQASTIKSILLAWILTLPAVMILGGGLFLIFRLFV